MNPRFALFAIAMLVSACTIHFGCTSDNTVVVSAASSLQNVLGELTDTIKHTDPSIHVALNFAASNLLARQIEQGSPIDVFASASESIMSDLVHKGLIRVESVKTIATNSLVIIQPLEINVARNLDYPKYALASEGVPIRSYAEQALRNMNMWNDATMNAVYAANERQIVDYVTSREVDFGVVYRSDAKEFASKVKIFREIDTSMHRPIRYQVGIASKSKYPADAKKIIDRMISDSGRAIFARHGFGGPQAIRTGLMSRR